MRKLGGREAVELTEGAFFIHTTIGLDGTRDCKTERTVYEGTQSCNCNKFYIVWSKPQQEVLMAIKSTHKSDGEGNPAGGTSTGTGFKIEWQSGPLGTGKDRKPPNGAFVEDVIAAALDRIQYYQAAAGGRFACRENALAITKLEEALHWLHARTAAREKRGVEGTNTP